jgi:hypothetical protein
MTTKLYKIKFNRINNLKNNTASPLSEKHNKNITTHNKTHKNQ